MTIFRSKKDKSLYKIYRVSPPRYTGFWYEAVALFNGEKIKSVNLKDFEVVASK